MTVRMNPYLVMDGDAREAVTFYEKALEAKVIGVQSFGDMPPDPNHPIPEEAKNRILHAALKVGETDLMLSDTFPGMPHQKGDNVNVTIVTDDPARTRRFFDALAEGGKVTMPLQETFWSAAYGSLIDRFGVPWQLSTEGRP